jgi:hypothetical protein
MIPSLGSAEATHPFVPTCLMAQRRAQALSGMPPAAPAAAGGKRPGQCEHGATIDNHWNNLILFTARLPPRRFLLIVGRRSFSSALSREKGEGMSSRFNTIGIRSK